MFKLMLINEVIQSMKPKQKAYTLSVDFLKKQKNGLIIGEYRNILYSIYQSIQSISNNSNNKCILLSDIFEKQTGNFVPIGVLLSYCEDLEELGYISIQKENNDYKLVIKKDIDF